MQVKIWNPGVPRLALNSAAPRRLSQCGGLVGAPGGGRGSSSVVRVNVDGLPGVVDPGVADGASGEVAAGRGHLGRQNALLLLVLVLWGVSDAL